VDREETTSPPPGPPASPGPATPEPPTTSKCPVGAETYVESGVTKCCAADQWYHEPTETCRTEKYCYSNFDHLGFAGKIENGLCVMDDVCLDSHKKFDSYCIPKCASPLVMASDGMCVDVVISCEEGATTYVENGEQKCCDPKKYLLGGICYPCKDGYIVSNKCKGNIDCAKEYIRDGYKGILVEGKCLKDGCLDGYKRDLSSGSEKCLKICNPGEYRRANGVCVDHRQETPLEDRCADGDTFWVVSDREIRCCDSNKFFDYYNYKCLPNSECKDFYNNSIKAYSKIVNGQCVIDECFDGYEKVAGFTDCIKCGDGQIKDPSTGKCVADEKEKPACAVNEFYNSSTGSCAPASDCEKHFSSSSGFAGIFKDGKCVEDEKCPQGYTRYKNSCVEKCLEGQLRDANGRCEDKPAECRNGQNYFIVNDWAQSVRCCDPNMFHDYLNASPKEDKCLSNSECETLYQGIGRQGVLNDDGTWCRQGECLPTHFYVPRPVDECVLKCEGNYVYDKTYNICRKPCPSGQFYYKEKDACYDHSMCTDLYKDEGRGGRLENDGSNCDRFMCYAGYVDVNGPKESVNCKAICKPNEIRDYTKECVYDVRYTHKACKPDEYHDFLKSKCVKKTDAACADHFRDQNFAGKLSHGVCVKDGCLPGYTYYLGKCVENPADDNTCSTIPPYDNTLYDHYYDPEKGACVYNKNCAIHFYDQGFSGLINTYRANGMFRHACEKGGCMVGYDSDGKGNCVPLQKPEAPPAPCVDQQFTKDGYKGVTVDGKCIKAGCLDTHELVKEKDGKIDKCLPRCADGKVRAGLNCVDPPNQQCLKPNPNRDKYGLGYYENGQPKCCDPTKSAYEYEFSDSKYDDNIRCVDSLRCYDRGEILHGRRVPSDKNSVACDIKCDPGYGLYQGQCVTECPKKNNFQDTHKIVDGKCQLKCFGIAKEVDGECVDPRNIPSTGWVADYFKRRIEKTRKEYTDKLATATDADKIKEYQLHLDVLDKLESGKYTYGSVQNIRKLRRPYINLRAATAVAKARYAYDSVSTLYNTKTWLKKDYGVMDEKGDEITDLRNSDYNIAWDWLWNFYDSDADNPYNRCLSLSYTLGKSIGDMRVICSKEIAVGDLFAFLKSVDEGKPKSEFLNGEGCCDDLHPYLYPKKCDIIYRKGEDVKDVCQWRQNEMGADTDMNGFFL
jgi:hypothetical protein